MRRVFAILIGVALLSATLGSGVASADFIHIVGYGETVFSIGRLYGVSPYAIASASGLANWNLIYPGQRLVIPSGRPSSPTGGVYIVRYGDTLSRIARWHGVSVSSLAAANGLANPNHIYVGQRLVIPGGSYQPSPAPGWRTYIVRTGDTLYSIGRWYGVSPAAIAAANGLVNWNYIQVGQALRIP